MRPILLIMWTAFQSFILRDNNYNDDDLLTVFSLQHGPTFDIKRNKNIYLYISLNFRRLLRVVSTRSLSNV